MLNIYRGLKFALMDDADRARQDFVRAVELKPALSSLIHAISQRYDLDIPATSGLISYQIVHSAGFS